MTWLPKSTGERINLDVRSQFSQMFYIESEKLLLFVLKIGISEKRQFYIHEYEKQNRKTK